jgi:hypothetical protein
MVMRKLKISQRRACKTIGLISSTQRYESKANEAQVKLESQVIELAAV